MPTEGGHSDSISVDTAQLGTQSLTEYLTHTDLPESALETLDAMGALNSALFSVSDILIDAKIAANDVEGSYSVRQGQSTVRVYNKDYALSVSTKDMSITTSDDHGKQQLCLCMTLAPDANKEHKSKEPSTKGRSIAASPSVQSLSGAPSVVSLHAGGMSRLHCNNILI